MTNGKLPWLQFFTGDWKKDPAVSACSPATRGIWMDALCAMHEDEQKGEIVGTLAGLARVCRCTPTQMRAALVELERTKTAEIVQDLSRPDKIWTVKNRRMYKFWTRRKYKRDKEKEYYWTKPGQDNGQVLDRQKSEVRDHRELKGLAKEPANPCRSAAKPAAASTDIAHRLWIAMQQELGLGKRALTPKRLQILRALYAEHQAAFDERGVEPFMIQVSQAIRRHLDFDDAKPGFLLPESSLRNRERRDSRVLEALKPVLSYADELMQALAAAKVGT